MLQDIFNTRTDARLPDAMRWFQSKSRSMHHQTLIREPRLPYFQVVESNLFFGCRLLKWISLALSIWNHIIGDWTGAFPIYPSVHFEMYIHLHRQLECQNYMNIKLHCAVCVYNIFKKCCRPMRRIHLALNIWSRIIRHLTGAFPIYPSLHF